MTDSEMRLDGNAAAGVLSEVFAADMTTAVGTCAACGMTGPLGAALVYMGAGTVVRCPNCSAVLMTFTHARERMFVEAAGVKLLQISA